MPERDSAAPVVSWCQRLYLPALGGIVSTMLQTVQHASWLQRLFVLILGCNVILVLWGIHVVPAIVTLNGIATTLATVGMQVAIAFLAFFGPLSFQHYRSSIGIAFLFGALFAVAYDGILLSDFVPSINLDVNIWLLFVGAASLGGFVAGYQSRRFARGVVVAIWALVIGTAIWSIGLLIMNYASWGSHQWYTFWLNDGAIDDFRHSGSTNLSTFLLQDMQGALFFHPWLSVFVGALCGLAASGVAQGVLALRTIGLGNTVS